jgi:hypothetical protein
MSMDITEILKLKDSIEVIQNRINSDTETIYEWRRNLQKQCPHPTSKTDSKYYEGGYDYLSSVRITVTCSICNKILKSYDDPKHKGMHS